MSVIPTGRAARRARGEQAAIEHLVDLIPGQRARVCGFEDRLSPQIQRRLGDLGIDDGVEITLLRRAPLGDPCVFRVRDYDLCLRRREAGAIRCMSGDDVSSVPRMASDHSALVGPEHR